MPENFFANPGLTIALALAAGILSQAAADHLRIPGIVILLIAGVLMGPDGAGIVRPDALGPALPAITGFAVAVILFEGGMKLKIQRLKRQQRSIRQLVTAGGAVTAAGGALCGRFIMGWNWQLSLLFGTLVIVTGPTVINPLLRRLKVKRNVATVLEAEGVLIDAIGAVVAMVALEAALSPAGGSFAALLLHVFTRLIMGGALGLLTGFGLVLLLRKPGLIPEGIENVFTLCFVAALFQISNAVLAESGIAAVTIAGIVVGNNELTVQEALAEFKEELTVMLIGLLFILLAADVRLAEIESLGMPAVFTVAALMLIVRPMTAFAGTYKSGLHFKEKLFIAWIGPRGIVAAAVASLFAVEIERYGIPGGGQLRAMVFLVITVTVLTAGLSGGIVADWLNLKRPRQSGWIILGANEVARAVARLMKEDGQEVVCIDSNPVVCQAAEEDCTRVIFGNGLQTRYLLRAEVDTRAGALALTPNEEVNYLFIQKAKKESRSLKLFCTLKSLDSNISEKMVREAGAQVAFAAPLDVEAWSVRIRRSQVLLQLRKLNPEPRTPAAKKSPTPWVSDGSVLALTVRKNGRMQPVGGRTQMDAGVEAAFVIFEPERERAEKRLDQDGWRLSAAGATLRLSTTVCELKSG